MAFALVQESGSQATLVSGQTENFTQISEPSKGVYCLTPGGEVNVNSETPVVSPEVSDNSPATTGVPGVIAVNIQHQHCPAGTYEVDTYAPGTPPAPANGYAFTILVPPPPP